MIRLLHLFSCYWYKYLKLICNKINVYFFVEINDDFCPNEQDYFPCRCSVDSIICSDSPISTIADIFKRKSYKTSQTMNLHLLLPPDGTFLPADLLSNHQITSKIIIICKDFISQRINIHQDAFRSSRNFISEFKIFACDSKGFDFLFMKDFRNMKSVEFNWNSNLHLANWTSFPLLSSLTHFYIYDSNGLDEWTQFSFFHNRLSYFAMYNNYVGDECTSRILSWLLESPSAETLEVLILQDNGLTKIPEEILFFKNLKIIALNNNCITNIHRKSFHSWPEVGLNLALNDIESIEDGAFEIGTITKMCM